MTQQHVLLDVQTSGAPESDGPLRLRLKPKSPTSGYVDGAWWPRSDDLAAELPNLLSALAIRLGPIDRVLYRTGEWSTPPRKLVIDDGVVRLEGCPLQPPATIEVQGFNRGRIVLLIVPPHLAPRNARATVMAAAQPVDADTVDRLFDTTRRPRGGRALASRVRSLFAVGGGNSLVEGVQSTSVKRLQRRYRRTPPTALATPAPQLQMCCG
ncbi:DUF5994 family protein [Mycobacterium vicinigordonae]|uniref:DUF5994 family protein n=1 Tax=Mycobacterium vicinigordonae TaxID=1719132 RepID=UPI001FEB9142|nr:DUF5994 family protein [Mycobacterium vicinigordonae]